MIVTMIVTFHPFHLCFSSVNMATPYKIVQSILSDLLEEITTFNLELSFTSSPPDHPLPCSQGFQFFSIFTTAPPHSSDGDINTSDHGVTPPSSPPNASPPDSLVSPLSSPGVVLLPLSAQMTQAPPPTCRLLQTQGNIIFSAECVEQEEPANKRVKLETDENFEPEDDEQDVEDVDDDDDLVKTIQDIEKDNAMLPFPLIFSTSANLMWKLQKADILPVKTELTSQRPGAATDRTCLASVGREDAGKEETREDDEQLDSYDASTGEEFCRDDNEEDCNGLVNRGKERQLSRPSLIMAKLLNRPPRLGLSKLDRRFKNLHEVTIIEKEE